MKFSDYRPLSAFIRFAQKVQPNRETGCWQWIAGNYNRYGYGSFRLDGRSRQTHQLAYLWFTGTIPDGYEIDHTCRNTGCCNPDHLEAVTHIENVRRGRVGKERRERTHCRKGHPYSPENTYHHPQGYRICRVCLYGSQDRYRSRVRKSS